MTKEEATTFVSKFVEDGSKYITIRIRNGYIGKELDDSGRKLQTERTKPRGTMVAIKGDNNDVFIGAVYLSNKDNDTPIIGTALALQNAIENKKKNTNDSHLKNKNDKDLYEFFKVRALCYFFPEIYSHSRGTDKIEYPNYDKIHKNRKRVLGED